MPLSLLLSELQLLHAQPLSPRVQYLGPQHCWSRTRSLWLLASRATMLVAVLVTVLVTAQVMAHATTDAMARVSGLPCVERRFLSLQQLGRDLALV